MNYSDCNGCDFLCRPIWFHGVRDGKPVYEECEDTEQCSCLHDEDTAIQLASIIKCPKSLNDENMQ